MKWNFYSVPKIRKSRDSYTLQYDLVDIKGDVVADDIWSWESKHLELLLLIHMAIEQNGVTAVMNIWANAKAYEKAQGDAVFKKTADQFCLEHLKELFIEVAE